MTKTAYSLPRAATRPRECGEHVVGRFPGVAARLGNAHQSNGPFSQDPPLGPRLNGENPQTAGARDASLLGRKGSVAKFVGKEHMFSTGFARQFLSIKSVALIGF